VKAVDHLGNMKKKYSDPGEKELVRKKKEEQRVKIPTRLPHNPY